MSGVMWLRTGALCGAIAVMAGAFGAHYLRERLHLEARALEIFETGVRYLMFHAVGLLVVGLLATRPAGAGPALNAAGWLFLAGSVLFTGSLFGLATKIGPASVLGPITPLGGLAFVAGWIALAVGARGGS
jgi:uncharacterized membrane protein YgdD (TMEM256/DUF423 family)